MFAGSIEQIGSFSSFESEALRKIHPGDILTAKGALMDFERGIAAETCFIVPHPQEKVAERITFWDQTPYPDLGVFIQGKLQSEGEPDFSKLCFIPSLRPVAKLMEKTRDVRVDECNLHLSSPEATRIAEKKEGLDANGMARIWSETLGKRFKSYQEGGLKNLAPYDCAKGKVNVIEDVDALLEEVPSVAKRFNSLFSQIKSTPNGGDHYWQLQEVDGTAVLVLGTIYKRSLEEGGLQIVDLQWYVSGGYYTAFTCYELHSLDVGKTDATLIWRGDYTSISMKQLRKGVERMFSVNVMIQEVKKSIRCFIEDLGKK